MSVSIRIWTLWEFRQYYFALFFPGAQIQHIEGTPHFLLNGWLWTYYIKGAVLGTVKRTWKKKKKKNSDTQAPAELYVFLI